jgi:hypothetical protein
MFTDSSIYSSLYPVVNDIMVNYLLQILLDLFYLDHSHLVSSELFIHTRDSSEESCLLGYNAV